MDLHNIREDYSKQELSKADCANTPLPQFEKWLNEAIHSAAKEPTAMSVATVMPRGDLAAKWVATNSIISPAPTNKTFNSPMSGKMRAAIFTAAAAMLTEFSPTAVLVRTSLAMAKVF